jgi:hypothetical protein
MKRETLCVVWKIIRRAGHGRTPETYCSYIAENKNNRHRLKTVEGTKLFEILENTVISKTDRYDNKVYIDAMYHKGNLLYITNPRVM